MVLPAQLLTGHLQLDGRDEELFHMTNVFAMDSLSGIKTVRVSKIKINYSFGIWEKLTETRYLRFNHGTTTPINSVLIASWEE